MATTGLTTFVLVRHALHVLGDGTIAGRTPGVHLSPEGHAQTERLKERLAGVQPAAIYCSPQDRTRETAQPLAAQCGLPVQTCADLQEIDYGDWTGNAIDDLRGRQGWKQWNAFRSGHRVPNGESMLEIQARVVSRMLVLRERHPDECVVLVSHSDVIKAAVAYCLGAPLDLFQRIEISPASITVVAIADYGPWVVCVNNTGSIEELPGF